jgi:hypothetical protein
MCETGHTDKQKLSSAPHGGSCGNSPFTFRALGRRNGNWSYVCTLCGPSRRCDLVHSGALCVTPERCADAASA